MKVLALVFALFFLAGCSSDQATSSAPPGAAQAPEVASARGGSSAEGSFSAPQDSVLGPSSQPVLYLDFFDSLVSSAPFELTSPDASLASSWVSIVSEGTVPVSQVSSVLAWLDSSGFVPSDECTLQVVIAGGCGVVSVSGEPSWAWSEYVLASKPVSLSFTLASNQPDLLSVEMRLLGSAEQ